MARTAADLTEQDLAAYRRTAQLRDQQRSKELEERLENASALARRAADLLRERFGASRVVVFGSLVREGCFTPWSDVDIAAWGLSPAETFRAMGVLHTLDPTIAISLIDVNTCSPSLLAVIHAEGREL